MKTQIIKTLAILFVTLSCLTSCQKEELKPGSCSNGCLVFEGYVYDNNETPLKEISMELSQRLYIPADDDDGLFSSPGGFDFEFIGTINTDENGFYSYAIDGGPYKLSSSDFVLSILDTAYIYNYQESRKEILDITFDDFDTPLVHDFTLYPKGYLALNFRNNISLQNMQLEVAKGSFRHYIRNIDVDNYNLVDVVLDFEVVSNQFVNICYEYERNDEVFTGADSIYIEKGEHLGYLLEIDY